MEWLIQLGMHPAHLSTSQIPTGRNAKTLKRLRVITSPAEGSLLLTISCLGLQNEIGIFFWHSRAPTRHLETTTVFQTTTPNYPYNIMGNFTGSLTSQVRRFSNRKLAVSGTVHPRSRPNNISLQKGDRSQISPNLSPGNVLAVNV